MSDDNSHEPQLQFPCDMHIKALGAANIDLEIIVLEIAQKHIPHLLEEHISVNSSKGGKYISVTVEVTINTRQELDSIYADLQACVHVTMVL